MTTDNTAHDFPITGPINLDVRVSVGTITVRAVDDIDTARVELKPRRDESDVLARTTVRMNRHTVAIRGPKGQGFWLDKLGGSTGADIVDLDIVVPAGTAMKLASYGADANVTGRAGSVHIVTGTGVTTLERVDGDLVARFANATFEVGDVSGSASLRFNGGHTHLGRVDGDVEVACGSGDVELDAVGGSVRARTGAGALRVGHAGGDIDVSTGSGELAVGLRPGQPARLDISTGHGRLISDLDVHDDQPKNTVEPTITIKARTGRGDVRLFRAA